MLFSALAAGFGGEDGKLLNHLFAFAFWTDNSSLVMLGHTHDHCKLLVAVLATILIGWHYIFLLFDFSS